MENNTTPPSLAVSDLILLQSIVQVACERGAFRAEEMSSIGQCYDKLTAWLAHMAPPPSEAPTEKQQQTEQPQGE